jgi:hypothetical protein
VEAVPSLLGAGSRIHSHQSPTGTEALIEVLGILLGHTHTHESSQQSAGGRTDPRARQGRCERPARDNGTNTRDRQSSDPSQQPDHSTQHSTPDGSGSRTLGSLGTGALDQLLLTLAIPEGHPNLAFRETFPFEALDAALSVCLAMKEAHHSPTLSGGLGVLSLCHNDPPILDLSHQRLFEPAGAEFEKIGPETPAGGALAVDAEPERSCVGMHMR